MNELEDLKKRFHEWRNLAIQFDHHRMIALSHLKALLQDHESHKQQAIDFLVSDPIPGEKLLAERLTKLSELNEEHQRLAFEEWGRKQGTPQEGWWFRQLPDGGYSSHIVDVAWKAWKHGN